MSVAAAAVLSSHAPDVKRGVIPTVDTYQVQRLPSRVETLRLLQQCGFDVLSGQGPIRKITDPDRIKSRSKRMAVKLAVKCGLRWPLTIAVRVEEELTMPIRLVCSRK